MTATRCGLALGALAALAAGSAASADDALPRLPTRLESGRLRTGLAMRTTPAPPATTAASAATAPTATATTAPATAATAATTATAPTATTTAAPAPAARKPARRRRAPSAPPIVTVPTAHAQLSLGLAVDGAGLADGTTVAGSTFNDGVHDFSPARAYGFGEAYLGTRGLVVPGVSAYLASQFQFAPAVDGQVPLKRAWDRVDPLQIRTAWTDADGLFDRGSLRTLRVRGGRQWVYGPAVAHVDGLSASWKTSRVRLGGYVGSRVPDWFTQRSGDAEPRGLVTGGELALVLRRGRNPLAVRARALTYRGATHSDYTLDWTARRDLVLAITSRLVGRTPAREHVTARYRWSEDTRVVFDADFRHRADWLWDYEVRDADPTGPRRYLDLGPRLPRVGLKVRAGTVLLDNIDLLVFGGLAVDGRGDDSTPSFTSAGWIEGGGALEVRMRRTFALSMSGLTRLYNRRDAEPAAQIVDVEDQAGSLAWPTLNVGERALLEGGVVGKFLGGARRFSVSGEIYARRTRYAVLYLDDGVVGPVEGEAVIDPVELHGGGRFLLEAWVTPQIRVRTEYDLSNRLSIASETDGVKSLRIVAEGTY